MKVTGLVPSSGRPSTCEGCDGWIIWAVTEKGRRMPVDAQLAITGNLVLWFEIDGLGQPVGDPPRQRVMAAPHDYKGPRWVSHFATCPKASLFRRQQADRGET